MVVNVRSHIAGSARGSLIKKVDASLAEGQEAIKGRDRTRGKPNRPMSQEIERGSKKVIVDEIPRDGREKKLRNKLLSSRTGLLP